jgi:hypothetical protein
MEQLTQKSSNHSLWHHIAQCSILMLSLVTLGPRAHGESPLLTPKICQQNATVPGDESRSLFLLEWTHQTQTPYYRVDVSLSKNFSRYQSFYTDNNFHDLGLKKDKTYFFRVQGFNSKDKSHSLRSTVLASKEIKACEGQRQYLQTNQDAVINDTLPELTFYPDDWEDQDLSEEQETLQVLTFPQPKSYAAFHATYFELEIAKDPNFLEAKRFYTHYSSLRVMLFPNQDYYFRYRLKDKERKSLSAFSSVQKRRIECCQNRLTDIPEEPSRETAHLQEIKYSEEVTNKIKILPQAWVNVGTGLDFTQQDQEITGFSNLSYQSLDGPSVSISGGGFVSEEFAVVASIKNAQGQVNNSNNNQNQTPYNLLSYSVESFWRPASRKGKHSQWYLRAGLQSHQLPLVQITNFANNQISLEKAELINLSLGGGYSLLLSDRLSGDIYMRYQQNLASSGINGELDPSLSFDGSVGLNYAAYKQIVMGLFWYGQLHQLDYVLQGTPQQRGNHSLFQSHIDFRLEYQF